MKRRWKRTPHIRKLQFITTQQWRTGSVFAILVNMLTANIIVCETALLFVCCTTSHSFVRFRFLAGGSMFCCQSLEKRSHKSPVCLYKAALYLLTNCEMLLHSFSPLIHVCSLLLGANLFLLQDCD